MFLCIQVFAQDTPPNIIVVMADDLGYETIGANGGTSYSTPHIDAMAQRGIRFEHGYAQPLCTPSRVQIMTGIYNVRNYVEFGLLEPTQTTFGHLFQRAGYKTCIVGKWQLGKDPQSPTKAGFDEHCLWQVRRGRSDSTGRDTRFSQPVLETNGELKTYSPETYGPRITADYALDFMERTHKEGKPFFLYYPMILTHCPFSPTPDSPEWAVDDTTVMKYKGQAHYFEDMMAYTDRIMGEINQKLVDLGIQENTFFLFTGDNGTDVPIVSDLAGRSVAGAKRWPTDAGTRVPLIIQWPREIPASQVSQSLVDFTDVLPTICDVAGVQVPKALDIDGQSFLPQMTGKKGKPRKWIYSWFSRGGNVSDAAVFARTQQYKLYQSGEFYDVPQDYLEEHPISHRELSPKQRKVRKMLQKVIDGYSSRRLADVPQAIRDAKADEE